MKTNIRLTLLIYRKRNLFANFGNSLHEAYKILEGKHCYLRLYVQLFNPIMDNENNMTVKCNHDVPISKNDQVGEKDIPRIEPSERQ